MGFYLTEETVETTRPAALSRRLAWERQTAYTRLPSRGDKNQYVFCDNNPVNFVDPFGLCKDIEVPEGWPPDDLAFEDPYKARIREVLRFEDFKNVDWSLMVPVAGEVRLVEQYGLRAVERTGLGLRLGQVLRPGQAVQRLQRGQDVWTGVRSAAKQVMKKASGGGKVIQDAAHQPGFFQHFHDNLRELGHAFFGTGG